MSLRIYRIFHYTYKLYIGKNKKRVMEKLFSYAMVAYILLLATYLLYGQGLMALDLALSQSVFSSLFPAIYIFNVITNLGTIVVFMIVSLWLIHRGNKKEGLILFVSLWIDLAINFLLKNIFIRERPAYFDASIWSLEPNGPLSFPSGHAQRAFLVATILSKYFKRDRMLLYAFAVLIGISRIAVGAHYALDVIVGALNGIVLGSLLLRFPWDKYAKFTQKQAQPSVHKLKR